MIDDLVFDILKFRKQNNRCAVEIYMDKLYFEDFKRYCHGHGIFFETDNERPFTFQGWPLHIVYVGSNHKNYKIVPA